MSSNRNWDPSHYYDDTLEVRTFFQNHGNLPEQDGRIDDEDLDFDMTDAVPFVRALAKVASPNDQSLFHQLDMEMEIEMANSMALNASILGGGSYRDGDELGPDAIQEIKDMVNKRIPKSVAYEVYKSSVTGKSRVQRPKPPSIRRRRDLISPLNENDRRLKEIQGRQLAKQDRQARQIRGKNYGNAPPKPERPLFLRNSEPFDIPHGPQSGQSTVSRSTALTSVFDKPLGSDDEDLSENEIPDKTPSKADSKDPSWAFKGLGFDRFADL